MLTSLCVVCLLSHPATPLDLTLTLPPVVQTMSEPSKDTRSHAIARGVLLAVAAALDIHSTRQSIQAGNVEKNSWLYGRRPTMARMVTVKTVVSGAMWLTSREAAKRHGRVEGMMPVAIYSAKQIFASIMNYKLTSKTKARQAGK